MRLYALKCLAVGMLVGCSSGAAPAPSGVAPGTDAAAAPDVDSSEAMVDGALPDAGPPPSPVNSETWADGKQITSSVAIAAGATVTIAPGATITLAGGATITVDGTLAGKSSMGTHAKLVGQGWGGIVVNGDGTLTLDGVDIQGAGVAIDTHAPLPATTYDNGTIDGATTPFHVEAGAGLSTAHAKVTAPGGKSVVDGSFRASYLDYDSNDQHAIWSEASGASVFIEDSTFHNSGPVGAGAAPDLLNGFGGTLFHVAYTDISGAHCGFHFTVVDSIEIDHVTVHDVANGADLWGSSFSGARTIASSNFERLTENLDENGRNGPITVNGCYMTGVNNLAPTTSVQITGPAAQPVPNAGPR